MPPPLQKKVLVLVRKILISINKTRHIFIYLLPIVGQTAEPNGLKFFVMGGRRVLWLKK